MMEDIKTLPKRTITFKDELKPVRYIRLPMGYIKSRYPLSIPNLLIKTVNLNNPRAYLVLCRLNCRSKFKIYSNYAHLYRNKLILQIPQTDSGLIFKSIIYIQGNYITEENYVSMSQCINKNLKARSVYPDFRNLKIIGNSFIFQEYFLRMFFLNSLVTCISYFINEETDFICWCYLYQNLILFYGNDLGYNILSHFLTKAIVESPFIIRIQDTETYNKYNDIIPGPYIIIDRFSIDIRKGTHLFTSIPPLPTDLWDIDEANYVLSLF